MLWLFLNNLIFIICPLLYPFVCLTNWQNITFLFTLSKKKKKASPIYSLHQNWLASPVCSLHTDRHDLSVHFPQPEGIIYMHYSLKLVIITLVFTSPKLRNISFMFTSQTYSAFTSPKLMGIIYLFTSQKKTTPLIKTYKKNL